MKTAERGLIKGAVMGEVLTIVRGRAALSIPSADASDLLAVLAELLGAGPFAREGEDPLDRFWGEAGGEDDEDSAMWNAIKDHLRSHPRAQGFLSLQRALSRRGLGGDNLQESLRELIDKRIRAGEMVKTPSGRYQLSRK